MLDARDGRWVMGPLYHANALWACLLPMLYVGGSSVILPGFVPDEVLDRHRSLPSDLFVRHAVDVRPATGALRTSDAYDVSSIRFLMCGSAPVAEELMRAITSRFHCQVAETYGLTEGGANVMTPRWGIKKLGSCGLPLPDVEVRIADLEDPTRDCPPGDVGELREPLARQRARLLQAARDHDRAFFSRRLAAHGRPDALRTSRAICISAAARTT